MSFLPVPPTHCPHCAAVVSLYPEPAVLQTRACGHAIALSPATGTLISARDLGAAALRIARIADGRGSETRRWERVAGVP